MTGQYYWDQVADLRVGDVLTHAPLPATDAVVHLRLTAEPVTSPEDTLVWLALSMTNTDDEPVMFGYPRDTEVQRYRPGKLCSDLPGPEMSAGLSDMLTRSGVNLTKRTGLLGQPLLLLLARRPAGDLVPMAVPLTGWDRAHRQRQKRMLPVMGCGLGGAPVRLAAMNSSEASERRWPRTRLVIITGPIASGKSTLAAELTRLLRGTGLSVVLIGLDTVAGMALPTLPDWKWVHAIHAQLIGAWLATGIDLLVDEGTSSPDEVHQVLGQVPTGADVFHVLLTADLDASLTRAQADPGRGVSKDPDFLRADHNTYFRHLPDLPCDLRLHVEGRGPTELAREVLERLF